MAACRSCGVEPARAQARFCDGCGAALAETDRHAEFKQVTVLFADVVGSMDIAAAIGPERLREVMAELVSRCAAVVQRYSGSVDKFTGDGMMAVFGAPVALEDHAVKAALAALAIQTDIRDLSDELRLRDGIDLRLRIGLNSGQVVAGEIGSGRVGYTTVGEQVGLAQRMESIARPGTVMVSESTVRLLPSFVVLGEVEQVRIKGSVDPVPACQLLAVKPRHTRVGNDPALVGRQWEMGAVTGVLNRSVGGRGSVIGVVGPPGIGKSRLAREAALAAEAAGADVVWTFCESHTSDIAFHTVTRLLKQAIGIGDLDGPAARERVGSQFADFDGEDRLLLEDLLGIRDPAVPQPDVAADPRRQRLTAMINAASLASAHPALYIIEDVHWIDDSSESMLADFFAVIPQTSMMVLLTYRPEYAGALARTPGMATIALAPLSDSETAALISDLAGRDPSVEALTTTIVTRVGGNPFFVEEMIRDLAERGVLSGPRGHYACETDVSDLTVPATLQATVSARIDRLSPNAKQLLSIAAVIGSRFDIDLLANLGADLAVDELVHAELIDQVRFTKTAEYAFRHPLIRTVAYETQLKSDRAQTHCRLAAAIQNQFPDALDENAALIAEHLETGGAADDAYSWHMRAGAWLVVRDVAAARVSWERAVRIADHLPEDIPNAIAMRIAPRTMLCASLWRGAPVSVAKHFDELRRLCELVDDHGSLAIGLYGLAAEHMFYGRFRESAQVASELMALLESTGYPESTIGVAFLAIGIKSECGRAREVMRLAEAVIDWADGDPAKGNVIVGSPLAIALAWRAAARWALGVAGWQPDLRDALTMARGADPGTHVMVVALKCAATAQGVLRADAAATGEVYEALHKAEGLSDDTALGALLFGGGSTLIDHDDPDVRRHGLDLLKQFRDMCRSGRFFAYALPGGEACIAREMARFGDRDAALVVLRRSVESQVTDGQIVNANFTTRYLVETLLGRAEPGDVAEAQAAIEQLDNLLADDGYVLRDIMVLRLRTLLAKAAGHDDYRVLLRRYREMAKDLGFEGHIAWAEAM